MLLRTTRRLGVPFTAADSASEMCAESDIIYTQTSVI